MRVQAGVTNLVDHRRGVAGRLLLRARPVLAARLHHRRQHRDELRRRALPEVRRHHQQRARRDAWCCIDGTIVEIGGEALDARGLRPARPDRRLGRPARRRHGSDRAHPARGGRRAAGAVRLRHERGGRRVRRRHHRRRHRPVAMEFMDKPAIEICEAFAQAGYPLDVEALLIIEVEGSDAEMDAQLAPHRRDRQAARRARRCGNRKSAHGDGGDLEGPQVRLRRDGPHRRLHLHGRHDPDRPAALRAAGASTRSSKSYGLRVANVFHAGDGNLHPLILYNVNDPAEAGRRRRPRARTSCKLCVEVGGCLTGEHGVGIEKRDLMRSQFTQADLEQQMRVRAVFDPRLAAEPGEGVPARRAGRARERCRRARVRAAKPATIDPRRGAPTRRRSTIEGGGTRAGLGRPAQAGATLSSRGLSRHHALRAGRTGDRRARRHAAGGGRGDAGRAAARSCRSSRWTTAPLLGSAGEPTIGAVAAGNISGPRRIMAGACRDSLIGVRIVNGRGEVDQVRRAGDEERHRARSREAVSRLLRHARRPHRGHRSRCCPGPSARRTLVLARPRRRDAPSRRMSAALGSPFEVTGAAHLPAPSSACPRRCCGIEGFAASVAYRLGELTQAAGALRRRATSSSGDDAPALWRGVRDASLRSPSRARSRRLARLRRRRARRRRSSPTSQPMARRAPWFYDWGGGLVWLADVTAAATPAPPSSRARQAARRPRDAGARARRSPRARADVFEPQPRR